ncbi:MAG TPA: glycoside hydrolase family 30 protein [Gemmatimonadaceae bacterium]
MPIDRRGFLAASSASLLLSQLDRLPGSDEQTADAAEPVIPERRAAADSIAVYTTADQTAHRISKTDTLTFKPMGQPLETQICVFADPSKRAQTILGIGGALTDASAETFAKLPADRQRELLDAYYTRDRGIGYTLGRTTIHSCDFSSASYTYVDEGDTALKSFSVAHDRQYRIPFTKQAIATAGGKLTIFASPWSPPAFMKTNGSMLHGGKLEPEMRQAWANYYVKFIRAYAQEGIPIWGITVQNEPMATQTWESCVYTAEEERDFLKSYLGPTIRRAGLNDLKIIAWDHNRDLIWQRVSTILADPAAAKYVWGIGYHWYEPWSGGDMMFDNVRLVRETFPDKKLIFTEGTAENFKPENINAWRLGEYYGRSMINDFNDGAVGWTDWNVLLDEQGGPNHVGNFCFAPIHADTKAGTLTYTSSYWYIGHFSKFVRPGARRIAVSPSRSALLATGFVNPDGSVAVVVMNRGDKPVTYNLWVHGNAAETTALPHSIQTLVF